MRAIGFSLLAAAMLAACGTKPAIHESAADTTGSPEYLTVRRQYDLHVLSSKPGAALKIVSAPNGDVFVLDSDNYRVLRFGSDGATLREAGGRGTGPLQFNNPIDFDSDGLALWVLDRQNQRLVRLDLSLNYVEQLALDPVSNDPTSALWYDAIATASSGQIILLDRAEPKAIMIAPDGSTITSYGGFGLGAGRLNDPTALAVALDGTLFVADGPELVLYDRSGNYKKSYSVGDAIVDVAAGESSAWVLTRTGKFYTLRKGELYAAALDPQAAYLDPVALDVSRDGDLVVLDRELSVWLLAPPAP